MSASSDSAPAPTPERRPSHGAQVLGSLLVALLLVLGAAGVAAAALNSNPSCQHPVEVAQVVQGGDRR
jgi:hypothetical protein